MEWTDRHTAHGFKAMQGRNGCPGLSPVEIWWNKGKVKGNIGIRGQEARRIAKEHQKAALRADSS